MSKGWVVCTPVFLFSHGCLSLLADETAGGFAFVSLSVSFPDVLQLDIYDILKGKGPILAQDVQDTDPFWSQVCGILLYLFHPQSQMYQAQFLIVGCYNIIHTFRVVYRHILTT